MKHATLFCGKEGNLAQKRAHKEQKRELISTSSVATRKELVY